MAVGEASTTVARPAEEILEFIMDVEAYRAVDPRLKTIKWVKREPGETVFMGLPGPMTTQKVSLTAGERVDITPVPSPMDRFTAFAGLLECTAEGSGTRVRRRLEFTFQRPLSWLMNPLLNRWLAKDVPAELARLKAYLEARPAS
jgi:hypothetical protein